MARVVPTSHPINAAWLGVDFSSAPSRRKPIWVALADGPANAPRLLALQPLHELAAFFELLQRPGPWVGGFDLPFGLPRAFADAQQWGPTLPELLRALRTAAPTRMQWRALIDRWGNTQPAGQRLLHRRCDKHLPAGAKSTSPLQSRYVPVALMFYEGMPRLLEAGLSLPGQWLGDPERVALEAYPGWLARSLIGARSYKNRDDPERRAARADLLAARQPLGLQPQVPAGLHALMLEDPSGDPLDAWLCLLQACWAAQQPRFGQPPNVDPLEGWISGAIY